MKVAIGPSSFAQEDKTPLEMLDCRGIEVVANPFGRRLTEDEIIEHLTGIDGLIAGLEPLNRKVLASTQGKLKALARVGIGTANVDFEAAREFGIKVSNTPEGPTTAVAELTLASLLSLLRKVPEMNAEMHAGGWPKLIATGMQDLQLLIIGYGRIGRKVGELAQAFGAELLVYDPYLKDSDLTCGERLVSLDEGLAAAHVITLHAAGEDTVLDAAAFSKMCDGVLILNCARGGLVDEDALCAALDSGKVAGGWFDTFWQEPYTGRLLQYKQMLLTPHVGTYTAQCRLSMETAAVNNLLWDLGLS